MSTPTSRPATTIKHVVLIALGAIAMVVTWPHAFAWMDDGGNILNPAEFFGDAIDAGGTAAFLSLDMLVAWVVFMIWVVTDAPRIGMRARTGWLFVLLSYVGVSLAFPVYIVVRERFLARATQRADQANAV